jgi:hypothetical protein
MKINIFTLSTNLHRKGEPNHEIEADDFGYFA